jgi:hypothetical protein
VARVLIVVVLVVVFPVVCWAAAASTRAGRWTGGALLALLGAGAIGLLARWPDEKAVAGLLAYPVAVLVVVAVGVVAERRRPGGSSIAAWALAGWLVGVCCGCPGAILEESMEDEFAGAPSSAVVLPPPAGLTVTSDEMRCASGGCWREVVLSGPGLPADKAAAVRGQLAAVHGWAADGWASQGDSRPDAQHQCRRFWWRLDLGRLCVGVRSQEEHTIVTISEEGF